MKALVLLSGGVDSSTCLGAAVDKYGSDNVIALSVFYGQKHKKELEAAENVAKHYGVPLKTLDLALIFADSDCSLLTGSSQDIPQEIQMALPFQLMCPSETVFSCRLPQALHSQMTAELSTTVLTAMTQLETPIPTAVPNSTMP